MTTIWKQSALLGLYNISPLHYGVGQTTGAIDLPIAREATTGFPVLPAAGIKGVLRDCAGEKLKEKVKDLFGPDINTERSEKGGELSAGLLSFLEGRLLAWPARALHRPFAHVTCPLILKRLRRDLRATGTEGLLALPEMPAGAPAMVADQRLEAITLVLENLVYPGGEVRFAKEAAGIARAFSALLPEGEEETREHFESGFAIVPDADFTALMNTAVPVQARVRLTGGKTTDKWRNPETGADEKGNLWYEEFLPSDCLFLSAIGERRIGSQDGKNGNRRPGLADLIEAQKAFQVVQLGGNETVGYGLSLLTLLAETAKGKGGGA